MYNNITQFYDLIYAFKDYESESNALKNIIMKHNPKAKTLLDVGCGTGNHLKHLKSSFDVVGLDVSAGLLHVAKDKLPDVNFYEASMRDFSMPQRFDVVSCMFGSIGYMCDLEQMGRAIENMAHHLTQEGILIFEPWLSPDTFQEGKVVHNLVDISTTKISWMYTQKRNGQISIFEIHYLLGTPDGVSYLVERQELGLYTEEMYRSKIKAADLELIYFDQRGIHGYGMFICRPYRHAA
jgi:ubiquinone/menaquinone biosynthesis C-methylase UbiE